MSIPRVALLSAFFVLACSPADEGIDSIVLGHIEHYPETQLPDIYNLLFHGAMGAGHGTVDSAAAAAWLSREIEELGAGHAEPVAEPIRGDSLLLRVNIRPFLAAGGDGTALLNAFLKTGREVPAEPMRLAIMMRALDRMATENRLPWSADSVRRFVDMAASVDHAMLPHSQGYLQIHRPAYRVVRRDLLYELLPDIPPATLYSLEEPPFPTGRFEDDYGYPYEIDSQVWKTGAHSVLSIQRWHATRQYLIASSRADSAGTVRWSRIDWIPLEGMPPYEWAFCVSEWRAISADSAEAVQIANPATPRTGCNGFPYSRMKRTAE